MNEYLPSTYGDRIADHYDAIYRDHDPRAVDRLAELAGQGPALELGIGTGRLALPLKERGVEVHGIDASEAMAAKLREKPGGADIPLRIGDFGSFELTERFSLIYVAFNTLFSLPTQAEQVECFRSVAAHLRGDGSFVVEAFVPDVARFDRGQRLAAAEVGIDEVTVEATRHDPVHQRIESQMIRITAAGTRLFPVVLRYAWPAELDLMGRLAGLTLRDRWSGWARQPFDSRSEGHVSVYTREG